MPLFPCLCFLKDTDLYDNVFTVLSDLSLIHNTEVLEDYFTVEVPLITNDLFLSIHGKNESHMSPRGFQFPT